MYLHAPHITNLFFAYILCFGLFSVTQFFSRIGFLFNSFLIGLILILQLLHCREAPIVLGHLIWATCPLLLIALIPIAIFEDSPPPTGPKNFQISLPVYSGKIKIGDVRKGISVLGAAGSGKTQSVLFQLLKAFKNKKFCGVLHDYKNFELTEIAYPIFRNSEHPFYIVSFNPIYHRVNPIAPRYMKDEATVNELAKVLMDNLLEIKDGDRGSSSRFFNDAAEGIIAGIIWRLKNDFPHCCTLPHLISLFQYLDGESLALFLKNNRTSRAMADAFINGMDSERQTAAVRSTLSNALRKLSSKNIYMVLSKDEIPLNINNPQHPAVVSIVNNPAYHSTFSPVIACLIHTINKQMSQLVGEPAFLLMEEAPTIKLANMHQIPATLRSYNIATVYVMQDKVQNDLLYGEKAGKAILSNLSYQFFGKVNDPDTAKYYEGFFELVKHDQLSVSQGQNLSFDTRITKSQREVSKFRAQSFFSLNPGEFISFADGMAHHVKFKKSKIEKHLPQEFKKYSKAEIETNFKRINQEIEMLFD